MAIKQLSLHCAPINEINTSTNVDIYIVKGLILLEVTKEINVDVFFVKLTGDANVFWSEIGTSYYGHDRYFKFKQYFIQEDWRRGQIEENTILICGKTYGSVIKPGRHVFPFLFLVPNLNLPPSFSGISGQVRYILTVKLERSLKSTSANKELTFMPRNVEISNNLLQPQSGTQDKKLKLFGSGKMLMRVSIEKTAYKQGETIRVHVDVDNSSSRDVTLKYMLYQKQTCIVKGNKQVHTPCIIKETKDCIPSGDKTKLTVDIKLPHDLMITIENCRIFKLQYKLKVYLDVPFAFDPEVKFPVVIFPREQLS